jgi:hypothetical protein
MTLSNAWRSKVDFAKFCQLKRAEPFLVASLCSLVNRFGASAISAANQSGYDASRLERYETRIDNLAAELGWVVDYSSGLYPTFSDSEGPFFLPLD